MRNAATGILREACAGYRTCALLDFSSIANLGDALLSYGGYQFLLREGIRIAYMADGSSFDEGVMRREIGPGGIILFNGGANISDLAGHANLDFRMRVVHAFPSHRIVMLPQSILLHDEALMDRVRRSFASHPDVRVLARDERSRTFCAEKLGLSAPLCPDTAFLIDVPAGPADRRGRVAVLRNDVEKGLPPGSARLFRGYRLVPWIQRYTVMNAAFVALRVCMLASGALGMRPLARMFSAALAAQAVRFMRRNVALAFRIVRRGDVVVSDRLHVAIASILTDTPFVALDNSYGKIRDVLGTWTPELLEKHTAANVAEALRKADALVTTR